MYYKDPLIPSLDAIVIFFKDDYPASALKRVLPPRVIKKMTMGVIQAETSFRSANWVDHGIAGITAYKGDKELDSLKRNFPNAILKHANFLPGRNPAYDDVGFEHSANGAEPFSPSASAIATYLANKTARNILTEMNAKGLAEEEVTDLIVKRAFVKALLSFRGVNSLSRMQLHTSLIRKWSGININTWKI